MITWQFVVIYPRKCIFYVLFTILYDTIKILVKRAQVTLVKQFTFLVNQTLTTGIFPRELTLSRVMPLRKKIKKSDPMLFYNYRPIATIFNIKKK